MQNFEIVKFENGEFSLDVKADYEKETVWLSKEQISLLYKRDRSVISRHIRNIYNENELDRNSSCAKNAHEVNNQIHYTDLYNLDVVISVGYRVKSSNGIMFRKWANSVLKEYLIKGVTINEKRLIALNKTIDIQNKMLSSTLHIDEFELSNVINEYTSALDLLDD